MFASRTNWSLTPNRLSQLTEERRQQGLPFLDLTESNPTHCGFNFDAEKLLGALADPRALSYEPDPRGLLAARLAVADYYAERGVQLEPAQIFLTTSTSEAYSYVFRLLANPGDAVLVPRPSYPLFDFLAGLNDVDLVPYPLAYDDGWRIELETLAAVLDSSLRKVRAIVVVHPNNPTGSFVSREELECLLKHCEGHALALVADEVFADYAFAPDDERVVSHAGISEVLTFTLSGLSKISALPQMKLAWVVVNGPPDVLSKALARLEVIADTYLSVSAPLALALPTMLETRRSLQPQILERVRTNRRWLDEQLAADLPVGRLKADGGWYAILKLPAIRSDEDWAVEMLTEDGVFVHPGHFYDFLSEGHLVVSLLPPAEIFQQGIRKLLARVLRHG
jgi:aspartate/methionine/tyrosine aminotransferase